MWGKIWPWCILSLSCVRQFDLRAYRATSFPPLFSLFPPVFASIGIGKHLYSQHWVRVLAITCKALSDRGYSVLAALDQPLCRLPLSSEGY